MKTKIFNSFTRPRTFNKGLFILFSSTIVIFFLGDILRKIAFYFDWNFTRFSTLSKILSLNLFLVFFLLHLNSYLKIGTTVKALKWIIGLIVLFCIGQACLKENIQQPLNFILNIEYLIKYLFFPIIILMFSALRRNNEYIKRIIIIFEITFFINLTCILFGAIFDIDTFKTYRGPRIGFMGIYSRSGQTSFYFIIFMLYYYWLILNENSKTTYLKLFLVMAVSLLLGTKRIYLFLLLFACYHFFLKKGYKNKYILGSLGVVVVLSLFFWQKLWAIFVNFCNPFIVIYNERGFLSSFTSFRSDMFVNVNEVYIKESWSVINFFVGGASFQDYILITGMDLFDLYLFFGILGFIVYYWIFKELINFRIKSSFFIFYFLVLGVISFLSSAFLYDPYVNLLFFTMICLFSNHELRKIKIIEHQKICS